MPTVYKYVLVNAQQMVAHIHDSILQELKECILELCNGVFTFDYSYHISRNVQARMKKLRFHKKNID